MKTIRPRTSQLAKFALGALTLLALGLASPRPVIAAIPVITDYQFPATISQLTATGKTVASDQAELSKINNDFGDAYRVKEGHYTYRAPDYLEYTSQVGPTTASLITTNTTRIIKVRSGFIKKDITTDISGDVTKRQTIFALGFLPQNFLETVTSTYLGRETVQGVSCVVFDLKFTKEGPNTKKHFMVWVDPDKHYVVQKRVWDMWGSQRETIVYLDPQDVDGTLWMPTRVEAYNQFGKFGGAVEYTDVVAK